MNSQPFGAFSPDHPPEGSASPIVGPTREGSLGVSLKEILPDAKPIGGSDLKIQSCCGSWQEIQPNDLYVAIVGAEADGHDYAQAAVDRGAAGVVTERLLAIDGPQFLVRDSRQAYGKLCQALAGHPAKRVTTIGVSGSDGKTVTACLIDSILNLAGRCSRSATSLGDLRSLEETSIRSEMINSPRLANWLAEGVISGCSHAVMEIHSRNLAQHCLTGMQLDVAVLTNLRNDHLDLHGTADNYRRVQQRLLRFVKPEGVAILNADDPNTAKLLDQLDLPALTVGIHQPAEVTAKLLERNSCEQLFMLSAGNESSIVRTQMIGKHHVYNCLAATAVGLALGIELPEIVRGLEAVGQIPGRLERVNCGQPFDVWIDSASRPNQLASAIHAVRQLTNRRVWVVASTETGQSAALRKRLGEVLERSADQAVITQSAGMGATSFEAAHQVLDGFQEPKNARPIPNRFRAIEWVLENAAEEDAVLIAGLGDRPIATISAGGWPVTDRDVCQAWLYDRHSFCPEQESRRRTFRIDDYRPGEEN